MRNRRLVLSRETLGTLESDELTSVSGGAMTGLHPTCIVTSYNYSQCQQSCGIGCTYNCLTDFCPTNPCT